MKRNNLASLLIVFAVIAMGSTVASAQTTSLRPAIEALVRVEGSPVKGVAFEPAAAEQIKSSQFAGELKATDVLEGLDELTAGTPFAWTLRSDRMVVIKLKSEQSPAPQPEPRETQPAPQPETREETRQAPIETVTGPCAHNVYNTPATWSAQNGMTEMEWMLARNRPPCPIPQVVAYQPRVGGYSNALVDEYMNGGYVDPYWLEYLRQYRNRGEWGYLKVDGPEGFLKNIHVFVDGHPLSPASKANGWNNEGLAIPAGPHDIQLMWLDSANVKVLSWLRYEIRPRMVQKTNWVGGKEDLYVRAPKATAKEESTYRASMGLTVGTMR